MGFNIPARVVVVEKNVAYIIYDISLIFIFTLGFTRIHRVGDIYAANSSLFGSCDICREKSFVKLY